MRALYPHVSPFVQHSLAVGDGHVLHAAEYGRRDGIPVVVLHGGPGGGSARWHPRLFDPGAYRVILFDQRGCGRSTPHGSLTANTTAHLVADIERVRKALGIEQWVVFGGSWGAALAVLYAAAFRGRVRALILRGVFLARRRDIEWFYHAGADRLLPEYWRDFVAPIPAGERDDLIAAYHARLFGRDDIARMAAARAWSVWEGRASRLLPNPDISRRFADPSAALALARIECAYFHNHCWLDDGEVLAAGAELAGLPGAIAHGRYDLVCPLEQADALARAWPDAEFTIVPDAGHAGSEPAMVETLVRTSDRLAGELELP